MHAAAQAYSKTANLALPPREAEAAVLNKAANRLQLIQDEWASRQGELDDALSFYRRVWTAIVSAVAEPDSPLPEPLRSEVISLGVFVLRQSIAAQAEPSPAALNAMINVNRQLAAGLSGKAADAR